MTTFDRAASYYDATRGLPPDVGKAVTDVLVGELAGRGRCLEVGVGTGRIARPLASRGVSIIGVDLSEPMLGELHGQVGDFPVPVACADARQLPLPTSSVGAVLFCHVLHLIPDWTAAVDEAVRVLRPNGVLLVDFGGGVPAPWHDDALRVLAARGIRRERPGLSQPEPLLELLPTGWTVRPLREVTMATRRSLRQDLDDWSRQLFSWTWPYTAEQLAAGSADVRAWAEDNGLDVQAEVELPRTIQWWAFERPNLPC